MARCCVFQLVARPDVVEMHDVTAQDPKLLVHLKATRNSVPVPRHWCFKRKYLQGKRGIEKPPFELPDFIKRTGIQEMREALQEKVGDQPGPRSARQLHGFSSRLFQNRECGSQSLPSCYLSNYPFSRSHHCL